MNWQKKEKEFEDSFDFRNSANLYFKLEGTLPEKEEVILTIRVLFLLVYWHLEGNYNEIERRNMEDWIKKIYENSKIKFINEAEYLFGLGVITRLNEYLFDIDTEMPNQYLLKAIKLNPNEKIYQKWYFYQNENSNPNNNLCLDILELTNWNSKYGLFGDYVFKMLL